MNGIRNTGTREPASTGWKVRIGLTLFVVSIGWPLLLPVLVLLGMSGSRLAAFSGGMLIVAEVLLIAAVAIAGKDGWKLITDTGRRFLRRFAPVHKVGRSRYRIGLVMFTLPLVLGWATPYLTALWTLEGHHLALAAVIGDLVFLTSLFILGGEFWQKLQSLFTYGTASDTTTAPSIGDQP